MSETFAMIACIYMGASLTTLIRIMMLLTDIRNK